MTRFARSLTTACVSACLTAVVLAQAPALNVKMGLWEVSSTSEMGGQMPGVDTSKMTPEQKAQMDAAMAGAMKNMMAPHTTVQKTCMTKEKFDKGSFMTDQPGMTCKQTYTTNTHTAMDANMVCTGERAMTGQAHFEAATPTAFKGTMKSTMTEQGKTMTVNVAMTGKWLGADCGDVK